MKIRELLFEVLDVDQTYQRYGQKIAQRLKLKDNDPELESKVKEFLLQWKDDNKQLNNTYTLWLLTHWLNQNIEHLEDVERARSYLETFEKNKGKISQDKRDINKYVPFESSRRNENQLVLQSEMDKFIQDNPVDEVLLARDIEKAKENIKIIHRDNQATIFQPLTELAASVFGRDTDWCTAYGYKFGKNPSLTNRFDQYNQGGPMFIFIFGDKTKYQLSNSSYQFMDAKNQQVESFDDTKWDSLRFLPEDEIDKLAKWKFDLIPDNLKTPERCLLAVKKDGDAIQYVPDELKTEDICKAAVQQNGYAIQHVPYDLITPEVCLAAVEQNGYALKYMPDELKTQDICLAAIQQNGYAIQYVPDELKTKEMFFDIIKELRRNYHDEYNTRYILSLVPDRFQTSEFYINCILEDPRMLLYRHTSELIPDKIKSEKFFIELTKKQLILLDYIPDKFKTEKFYLDVLAHDYRMFIFLPEELRTQERCRQAVERNGLFLSEVPYGLRTLDICLAAVKQNAKALEYVPNELQDKIKQKLRLSNEN
jgi:hypothetical protein